MTDEEIIEAALVPFDIHEDEDSDDLMVDHYGHSTYRERYVQFARAVEAKARKEAYADAPNQPDVQEAVIKKLDLVSNEAVEKARKEAAQRCWHICKNWEGRYVDQQFMENATAAEQCAGSISEEFGL